MRISDICYIYALLDPQTGVVRYIGKTIRPKERLKQHIDRSKKPRYKKECWIKSLINKGLYPEMIIIDECDFEDSSLIEEMYISLFKGWGFDLTNLQSKSANGVGRHSNYTRYKISKSLKGKKQSKETIEKRRLSVTKAWENIELLEKQRDRSKNLNKLGIIGTKGMVSKKKGQKLPEETKKKVSLSLKKYYSENKNKKIWNPDNKLDIINDYVKSEMSVFDIGVKYGVNRNMITRLIKREGIKLRNDGSKKIERDDLLDVLRRGLKTKDIAIEFNCSIAQVEKYKKKYNLTNKVL